MPSSDVDALGAPIPEDEIPNEYARIVASRTEAVWGEMESEDAYRRRATPHVPASLAIECLSQLWGYPTKVGDDVAEALDGLADACADDAERAGASLALHDAFSAYVESTEIIVGASAAQLDYTRLFIGSFKMYAPPYASYYLDGTDQVFGPTAAALEDVYAQFGLEVSRSGHEMPDHIRNILFFMSLLAKSFEQTGSRDFALAYTDFKEDFFDSWIEQFADKVHRYSEYPFYPELVDVTRKML